MPCPYENNDTVDVILHDHLGIQFQVGETGWQSTPYSLHHPPRIVHDLKPCGDFCIGLILPR